MNTLNRYKSHFILFIFFLLTIFSVTAQNQQLIWHWIEQLGGPGWDISNGIICDSKNKIYIGGGFTGNLACGKKIVESKGNRDIYIARFQEDGKIEWLWRAGGIYMDKITALENAPDNDLYITGITEGESKFGDIQITGYGKKLFIARINKKGKCDWIKTFNFFKAASSYLLKTDYYGNVYLGGVFSDSLEYESLKVNSNGYNDIFIARFNSSGKLEFLKSFGGKGKDQLNAISINYKGDIFLAGNFERDLKIDDKIINPNLPEFNSKVFLFQLNSSSSLKYFKIWNSPSYVEITGMAINKLQQLFISGNFSNSLLSDSLNIVSKGTSDFFVSHLDTTFKTKWIKSYGSKYITSSNNLLVNKFDGVMLVGNFNDTLHIDSIQLLPKNPGSNLFSSQFTKEGKLTWVETIGSNGGKCFGIGIAIDQNGGLYLTGTFSGSIKGHENDLKSKGEEDVFVAKYFNCPPVKNIINFSGFICPDSNALISVPNKFINVVWNDSLIGNEILIEKAGSYRVNMVDKNGCVVKDSVNIKLAPKINFSLGNDTAISTKDFLLLKGPENANKYQWQDNSTGKDYLATSINEKTGIYQFNLTITDSFDCNWNDKINVDFYKEPDFIDLSKGNNLIELYPNPVKDILTWSVKTDKDVKLVIELTDSNGKVFLHEEIKRYLSEETRVINMISYPLGIYSLNILSGNLKITSKIIKE